MRSFFKVSTFKKSIKIVKDEPNYASNVGVIE